MPTGCMLVALACLAGTAGASTLGGAGIEARVDAIERKFAAELRQAEDRMSSELNQMRGELGQMGSRLDQCETAAFHEAATATIEREEEPEIGRRKNESDFVDGGGGQGVLEAGQMQKPSAGREEMAALLSEEKDQEIAGKDAMIDWLQEDKYALGNRTQAIEITLQQQKGQIAAFQEECKGALHAFSNILEMKAEVTNDQQNKPRHSYDLLFCPPCDT